MFAMIRHKLPVNTSLTKMKQNHGSQYMIKRGPMLTHEQAAILLSTKFYLKARSKLWVWNFGALYLVNKQVNKEFEG